MRAALMVLAPTVALLVAEGSLRLFGYGYPTSFFVRSQEAGTLVTNERFALQFFSGSTALKPFLFTMAAKKPAGTIRICILGESAAMGTPDPAFGFGRVLEIMLRRAYPDRHFEVINAATRGINSHIIRLIVQECLRHQMDYVVAYMGNNEVSGPHAPGPKSPRWTQSLTFIRATLWLRSSRLGQCLASLGSGLRNSPDDAQAKDMDFFRKQRMPADDWRREVVGDNFHSNIEDICRAATGQGAKLVLATVAVNLKDCPPLGSLHRTDLTPAELERWERAFNDGKGLEVQTRLSEAAAAYESAAQIDGHFAELQFRLGRCYLGAGDAERAPVHYEMARDWDAMQFRTDARINEIIRRVGARWQGRGVVLADVEKAFAESPLSDHGVAGGQLFNDHVHPTFAGTYLLAQTVYAQLSPVLEQSLGRKAQGPIPTLQECSQAVPYTLYDDLNVASSFVGLTSRAPFLDQMECDVRQRAAEAMIHARQAAFSPEDGEACLKTYKTVIGLEPAYWPPHLNMANLYQDLGRYPAAIEELRRLTQSFPGYSTFSVKLALALLKSGDKPGAVGVLQDALKKNPKDSALQSALRPLEHSK
jgi:tetratricopeptide (TPR) repeat protein